MRFWLLCAVAVLGVQCASAPPPPPALARALDLTAQGFRTTAVRRLTELASKWPGAGTGGDSGLAPLAHALCRHGMDSHAARMLHRAISPRGGGANASSGGTAAAAAMRARALRLLAGVRLRQWDLRAAAAHYRESVCAAEGTPCAAAIYPEQAAGAEAGEGAETEPIAAPPLELPFESIACPGAAPAARLLSTVLLLAMQAPSAVRAARLAKQQPRQSPRACKVANAAAAAADDEGALAAFEEDLHEKLPVLRTAQQLMPVLLRRWDSGGEAPPQARKAGKAEGEVTGERATLLRDVHARVADALFWAGAHASAHEHARRAAALAPSGSSSGSGSTVEGALAAMRADFMLPVLFSSAGHAKQVRRTLCDRLLRALGGVCPGQQGSSSGSSSSSSSGSSSSSSSSSSTGAGGGGGGSAQSVAVTPDELHRGIGFSPTYGWVYHGYNDRAVMEMAAALYARLGAAGGKGSTASSHLLLPQPLPSAAAPRTIRVGILSAHFYSHTMGKVLLGLVAHLPRGGGDGGGNGGSGGGGSAPQVARMEVVLVMPPMARRDAWTAAFEKHADSVLRLPAEQEDARARLRDARLDVLLFADVGMSHATYLLGFGRYARAQVAFYGHPVTTGLPSIDYFVSGVELEGGADDLPPPPSRCCGGESTEDESVGDHDGGGNFSSCGGESTAAAARTAEEEEEEEEEEGDGDGGGGGGGGNGSQCGDARAGRGRVRQRTASEFYTEQLVRFEGNAMYFPAPHLPAAGSAQLRSRAWLGLPREGAGSVYVCPQQPQKLHPRMDALFAAVLAADPGSVLALLEPRHDPQAKATVGRRLVALLGEGEYERRVVWVALGAAPSDFMSLLLAADVFLDTAPFGGGITALDALRAGLPIVSLPPAQSIIRQVRALFAMMCAATRGAADAGAAAPGAALPCLLQTAGLAANATDYVAKATRLATDRALNRRVRDLLSSEAAQAAVFEDQTAIAEWSRFLRAVAAAAPNAGDGDGSASQVSGTAASEQEAHRGGDLVTGEEDEFE
jgi:hypothetical protein